MKPAVLEEMYPMLAQQCPLLLSCFMGNLRKRKG